MKEDATQKIVEFDQPSDFYFRTALRAVEAEDFPGAVAGARTALQMEPDNPAYRLLLADSLAEVRRFDESTYLLLSMLADGIGPADECLYMLGNNFISTSDYEMAADCYERYLKAAPDGSHTEEVRELLPCLQAECDDTPGCFEDVNECDARRKVKQAKRLLETGSCWQAATLLESVPPAYADAAYVRNVQALALFGTGQRDRAVQLTGEMLSKEPNNVDALCNMVTFLYELQRPEEAMPYLARLDAVEAGSFEEQCRAGVLLGQLGQHERAYRHLHEHNQTGPADALSLFYEAVAAHNTGRSGEAVRLLSDVRKFERPAVVPDYFLKLIKTVAGMPDATLVLPYAYRLPAEEARSRLAYLNRCLRLDESSFHTLWRADREFENTLLWALDQAEDNLKISICVMIAGFGDSNSEATLRWLLLRPSLSDAVKREAAVLLDHIGARGPFLARMSAGMRELHVEPSVPDVIDFDHFAAAVREGAELLDRLDLEQAAVAIVARARYAADRDVLFNDPAPLAAAALWLAGDAAGAPVDLAEVAAQCGADQNQVRDRIDRLAHI